MKLLVAGDFRSHGRVERFIDQGDYPSVFGDVQTYTSLVDFSIVNLESPVISHEAKPIEKQGPNLCCSSKAIEALVWAGFDMVTLANNHFFDYGEQGVRDTLATCEKCDIETVGGGKDIFEAQKVFYKRIGDETLAVINCCEHEFSIATSTTAGSNPLNPIRQYYSIKEAKEKADYVLLIVHGGHEFYQLPSPRMVETYRFFIDLGVDVVINHHQHCYSGYEWYKGKPIFYGLGNFSYDCEGIKNEIWHEGFMLQLELNKNKIVVETIPYVQGKEVAGVRVVKGEEKEKLQKEIERLNSIIINDGLLNDSFLQFVRSREKGMLLNFYPLSNRYARALYVRNLLPTCWTKKKSLAVRNMVECEAHRDVLLNVLSRK